MKIFFCEEKKIVDLRTYKLKILRNMLLIILLVIAICLFTYLLVKLIDKYLSAKARPFVSIILGLVTLFFFYLIYASIMEPIKFDAEKNRRYEVAVNKLLDIKKAQSAHKSIKGTYAANYDELVKFIESEKFEIIERRDTAVPDVARNAAHNLPNGEGGYYKDVVITKSLGFVSVKDSLFKNSSRYKEFKTVKIADFEVPVKMTAGSIMVKDKAFPTLEVVIDKNDILKGMDEELLKQEKKKKSIEEINGDKIILGSTTDITLTGNWPKKYGNNE